MLFTSSEVFSKDRKIAKVRIKEIQSFIFGPRTLTFEKLKSTDKQLHKSLDHCLYLSLVKTNKDSLDFKFEKRADLINLVVALSVIAQKVNPHFFALTNRALITNYLIKMKIV